MDKNSNWFKHDYSASLDQKILMLRAKYGMNGYGIFWYLLETMCRDTDGFIQMDAVPGIAIGMGVLKEELSDIISYCLDIKVFGKCEHGNIFNIRILEHKAERKLFTEHGKKGGEQKHKNQRLITPPTPRVENNSTPPVARRGEERRGEEIKREKVRASADPRFNEFKDKFFENVFEWQHGVKYICSPKDFSHLKQFLANNPDIDIKRFGRGLSGLH